MSGNCLVLAQGPPPLKRLLQFVRAFVVIVPQLVLVFHQIPGEWANPGGCVNGVDAVQYCKHHLFAVNLQCLSHQQGAVDHRHAFQSFVAVNDYPHVHQIPQFEGGVLGAGGFDLLLVNRNNGGQGVQHRLQGDGVEINGHQSGLTGGGEKHGRAPVLCFVIIKHWGVPTSQSYTFTAHPLTVVDTAQICYHYIMCILSEPMDTTSNALLGYKMIFSNRKNTNDLLVVAAEHNVTQEVARLLSLDYSRFNCNKALRVAAENGHTDCVELLIPVSDPLEDDSAALYWTVSFGQESTTGVLKCVQLLICVSDVQAADSRALRKAILLEKFDLVDVLYAHSNPQVVLWDLKQSTPNSLWKQNDYDQAIGYLEERMAREQRATLLQALPDHQRFLARKL